MLADYLASIELSVDAMLCHDVLCKNASHAESINLMLYIFTQIIIACTDATSIVIPTAGICDPKKIPVSTEYVEPIRQKSLFWLQLWCKCGRPSFRSVADVTRRTRALFHHTIKRVTHNEQFCSIKVCRSDATFSELRFFGLNFANLLVMVGILPKQSWK